MAVALCRVASLGRAIRRGPVGANYIGAAIEGQAAGALRSVQSWTCAIPCGAARQIDALIRACLGHGDRAVLGSYYAGRLVEAGGRLLESD